MPDPASLSSSKGPLARALWESLDHLRETVENDHDHRLGRIEANLHWVTFILGDVLSPSKRGQIVSVIGSATAVVLSGR